MSLLGAKGEEGPFVREGKGATLCCSQSCCDIWRRRVAEYEEFDEGTEDENDR